MTSLRHRELGATLRQCCLTGQPATVLIDHKEYEVNTKPANVTDADPAAEMWWCMQWNDGQFQCVKSLFRNETVTYTYNIGGDLRFALANAPFSVGYTPNIHDLNDALKPYNVSVPVPEEACWWYRNYRGDWSDAIIATGPTHMAYGDGTWSCLVWATTETREAIARDLHEAALKAGKP